MRLLLGYWVFGCLLFGLAVGGLYEKCPNDPGPTVTDAVAFAATWPLVITAIPSFIGGPEKPCEAQP